MLLLFFKIIFLVNWCVVKVEGNQQYSSKSVPSITQMIYIALGHVEEEVDQLSENAVKAKLPNKLQCLATQPVFFSQLRNQNKGITNTISIPIKINSSKYWCNPKMGYLETSWQDTTTEQNRQFNQNRNYIQLVVSWG